LGGVRRINSRCMLNAATAVPEWDSLLGIVVIWEAELFNGADDDAFQHLFRFFTLSYGENRPLLQVPSGH